MESFLLRPQTLGLLFLIVLNICALVMVYTEYVRSKHEFTMFVGLGQLFSVFWHFLSLYLSYFPESPGVLNVVGVLVFLSSLFFCKAVLLRSEIKIQRQTYLVGAFSVTSISFIGLFAGLNLPTLLWAATTLVFLVTPWITIQCKNFNTKWIIASLQLLLAPGYGIGVAILLTTVPEIGGLIYFFVAMLIPSISLMFLLESVQISTREIQASESTHRELFETVRDVFYRAGPTGTIEMISSSVKQFGYSAEELIGRSIQYIYSDYSLFSEHMQQITKCGIPNVVPLLVETKNGFNLECELSANAVRDDRGNLISIVGTIRDVTERNRLELQYLESQRRESLGILAGGMAHDFNNLLQGIVGRVELILMGSIQEKEEIKKHLSVILEASETAGRLCMQLLEYTGKAQLSVNPVQINSAIQNVIEMLRPSIPSNVKIIFTNDNRDTIIDGDITQIQQVFLNLIRNAIDATEGTADEGRITVKIEEVSLERSALNNVNSHGKVLQPGDYACIEVKDSGHGIDAAILDKIFDPFYSTKTSGHGLGLAAIVGILRSHSGGIVVESRQQVGSTFRVLLPISKQEKAIGKIDFKPPQRGDNKTILLADDEARIRVTTTSTLQRYGYNVLTAEDGLQAVETYRSNQNSISAVLMDIKMPNKDGIEATREIRNINPGMPIVLASGYANVANRLTSSEMRSLKFLSKPYRAKEVLSSIEDAMANSTSI